MCGCLCVGVTGTFQRIDIPMLSALDQYNFVLFTGEWAAWGCAETRCTLAAQSCVTHFA